MRTPMILALPLLLTPLAAWSASPAGAPESGHTVSGAAPTASTEQPDFDPIHSRDPAVRAQIKHLHLDLQSFTEETLFRIDEVKRALAAETDPDFRWEMTNEIGGLKRDLEIRNVEIGLEIAQLEGHERRAAEFALALDQLLHPERYFPAPSPDPALKEARLREHGLK